MSDDPPTDQSNIDASAALTVPVGPETIAYLEQRALQSFERQLNIEESIWRSLPFFTGALIAASALLGYAAPRLPPPELSLYSVATHGLLLLSVVALAWSFRWLWEVAKPLDYEYPADDEAIAEFAEQMTGFHAASGVPASDVDSKVTVELRTFMVKQLGDAARRNFGNNQARLSARSQVLLFLAAGFVLAFAEECTIFVHDIVTVKHEGPTNGDASSKRIEAVATAEPAVAAPRAAAGPDRSERRDVQQDKFDPADQKQVTGEEKKPSASPPQKPQRPEAPQPQWLKKNEEAAIHRK